MCGIPPELQDRERGNMLTSSLGLALKYNYLEDRFRKAYAFLESTDLMALSLGRVDIDGDRLFAIVQEYTTMDWKDCRYEAHDRYFDIQYVAVGREQFGYVKREGLKEAAPYSEADDLVFFEEPEESGRVLLEAGDFAVVPPEDAHKPRCAAGTPCRVRKIVVKVLV